MKYFVAYRFSGEDRTVLDERLGAVVEAMSEQQHEAYCNLFDQHEYDAARLPPREIMAKAFAEIDEREGLFVLIASSDKSEGQLMEVGYALAKKKHIIVAAQRDAVTYVDQLANVTIRWSDIADLKAQIAELQV